jgi:hypothetical protein
MPERLTELGRRVLGNLPAWAADEAAVIAEEGGPERSVRSHSLAELASQLAVNTAVQALGANGPLTPDEVQAALLGLAEKGLATEADGQWRMTQAGFEAITASVPDDGAPAGAVTVETHPAQLNASAAAS